MIKCPHCGSILIEDEDTNKKCMVCKTVFNPDNKKIIKEGLEILI